MYSLILIAIVGFLIRVAWRWHRKWQREVGARRRVLKRVANRVQSKQERVLHTAARETRARQYEFGDARVTMPASAARIPNQHRMLRN